jgi:hypothetical protein
MGFGSSLGTLVLNPAYADWLAETNTGYRGQQVGRAVDLLQLFRAAAYGKNGADIRLAVDAAEDRLPDLTHVVMVCADTNYAALTQRCKRIRPVCSGHRDSRIVQPLVSSGLRRVRRLRARPGVPAFEPIPCGICRPAEATNVADEGFGARRVDPSFSERLLGSSLSATFYGCVRTLRSWTRVQRRE